MCTGSDSYQITENWVCGNFSPATAAASATWLSDRCPARQTAAGPLPIADNRGIFNESFLQGQTVSGGGIFVGGAAALAGGGLSPGAGNVAGRRAT